MKHRQHPAWMNHWEKVHFIIKCHIDLLGRSQFHLKEKEICKKYLSIQTAEMFWIVNHTLLLGIGSQKGIVSIQSTIALVATEISE